MKRWCRESRIYIERTAFAFIRAFSCTDTLPSTAFQLAILGALSSPLAATIAGSIATGLSAGGKVGGLADLAVIATATYSMVLFGALIACNVEE